MTINSTLKFPADEAAARVPWWCRIVEIGLGVPEKDWILLDWKCALEGVQEARKHLKNLLRNERVEWEDVTPHLNNLKETIGWIERRIAEVERSE